jgi:hypothetical protein
MATRISLILSMFAVYQQVGGCLPNSQNNIERYETFEARASSTGYVDYLPGTGLNVMLSNPHDGALVPDTIPDRDAGCWDATNASCVWSHTCGVKDFTRCAAITVRDYNTAPLTLELRQALCDRFNGRCPGTVINLLARTKLDPNREINEATFGVPLSVEVYNEYHAYLAQERANISGMGLYIDIHEHGHSIQRSELGYLVPGPELDSGNPIDPAKTSIRNVANHVGGNFDELLRGPASFGGMLEQRGFRAVPSPTDAGPGGQTYFSGGYCTVVYGSRDGGLVDAIQIESPISFCELPTRQDYVVALVDTIAAYLAAYYPTL